MVPAESAITLNATYPFYIPIILFFLFKEEIKKSIYLGVFIGFIGVYFMVQPSATHFSWATLFALVSGIFTALANVTMSILRKTDHSFSIVFYFFLFSTIASFIYMLLDSSAWKIDSILFLLAIALLSVLSQQLLAYVLKFLHPNVVSSIMYLSIVFGVLFSWLLWKQTPAITTSVGILLVMVGSIVVMISSDKQDK
ncbi:DMT family transporter [Thermoflavimicrobium daqui]|jgi:drug/metabolite transporter (DMT)-like permease|nr:DMT family transporter [Thermoflavimicrobium daqui]